MRLTVPILQVFCVEPPIAVENRLKGERATPLARMLPRVIGVGFRISLCRLMAQSGHRVCDAKRSAFDLK
jgi:hypothetical protein